MIFETVNLWILKKLSKAITPVGDKARKLIIFACFFGISLMFSLYPRSVNDGIRMAVISFLVLILAAMFASKKIKPVSWNRLPAFAIELFALTIIIIRPIHPVGEGYLIFAFDILLVFPMLYIALQNASMQKSFTDLLTSTIVISGVICFVYSILLAIGGRNLIANGRVAGATGNPNYYGMVGLSLVLSCIYGITRNHKSIMWEVVSAISAGIGISMILVSVSRTATLSALVCLLSLFVYVIKKKTNIVIASNDDMPARWKLTLKRVAVVLLAVASAFGAITLQQRVYFQEQTIDESAFRPPLAAEVYAEDNKNDQENSAQPSLSERLSSENDLNEFSSGRLGIWQMYIEHFNLTGNDYDAETQTGSFVWLSESRAHNNFIDYAYRFGIPAGLLYAVFYLAVLIKAIRMVFWKRKTSPFELWVVMVVASYAIYAMVEISSLPFTRYIPCLFFLSAAPLLIDNTDNFTDE